MKDYLRQGLDFAGGLAKGDQESRNFTARRVRDLPFTAGVTSGGSTIHVEEAGGLRDVYIYDNVCNHSILASGPTGAKTGLLCAFCSKHWTFTKTGSGQT